MCRCDLHHGDTAGVLKDIDSEIRGRWWWWCLLSRL